MSSIHSKATLIRSVVRISLLCALVTAAVACQTTPPNIPSNLTAKEFFQKAQEAVVERSDYKTALYYYETFLKRFPNDLQRDVEANYEIAFIHYRLKDYKTAETQFKNLLAEYNSEGADVLPQWPKILATKILAEMQPAPKKPSETPQATTGK